jgi:hypothetical protein
MVSRVWDILCRWFAGYAPVSGTFATWHEMCLKVAIEPFNPGDPAHEKKH